MLRSLRRTDGRARGQSVVEFALILPVLLALTLTVIDLARAVYYYNTLSNCAREGARFGILLVDQAWGDTEYAAPGNADGEYPSATPYLGTDTIVGRAAAKGGVLNPDQLKVSITHDPYGHEPGFKLPLTVTVEHPYTPAITYLVGGITINMKASSMMRKQEPPLPSTPSP